MPDDAKTTGATEALEKEALIIFLVQLLIITIMEKVKKKGRPVMFDVAGCRRDIVKNIRLSKNDGV